MIENFSHLLCQGAPLAYVSGASGGLSSGSGSAAVPRRHRDYPSWCAIARPIASRRQAALQACAFREMFAAMFRALQATVHAVTPRSH